MELATAIIKLIAAIISLVVALLSIRKIAPPKPKENISDDKKQQIDAHKLKSEHTSPKEEQFSGSTAQIEISGDQNEVHQEINQNQTKITQIILDGTNPINLTITILFTFIFVFFATPLSNNTAYNIANVFVSNTPIPTLAPTPILTETLAPAPIPTETPVPPCTNQISITRPLENEQITAFRKQTGNLYWFDIEGEITICPDETASTPQDWSILFITELDSPRCILAYAQPLYNYQTAEWNTTIPVANTTILGEGILSPPIFTSVSVYLVQNEDIENLPEYSSCKFGFEDFGLSSEILENSITDRQIFQLIKLNN